MDASDELSDKDFDRVRQFIKARAGLDLNDSKRSLVVSRLLSRMRKARVDTFEALLDAADVDDVAAESLVNALTTNVTSFFREPHHFELLQTMLASHQGPFSAWSSACSTGEEPWSIAGTILGARKTSEAKIFASDIDSEVLETARAGMYPLDCAEPVPLEVKRALFQKGTGSNAGWVRVTEPARSLVSFGQVNLLEPLANRGPFDVVFCRNVLIYFDAPTRQQVVAKLVSTLKPGGLLFLGHSESLMGTGFGLVPCGRTTFRKPVTATERRAS